MNEAMNEACKMLGVKTAEEMVAELAQVMVAGDTMATQLEIVARDLRSLRLSHDWPEGHGGGYVSLSPTLQNLSISFKYLSAQQLQSLEMPPQ